MATYLIQNATIINEGVKFTGNVLIENQFIKEISTDKIIPDKECKVIDATGKYLIPGVIDDQVHFREPGLTHKGDIASESAAAVAGGITSFMEMPNTIPQATTIEELEKKYQLGAEKSLANYSFYLGATNDNLDEIRKINPANTCGLKVFMGSSTGNMLVDKLGSLEGIFAESPVIITTHCEDENTINSNTKLFKEQYGEELPFKYHADIRSAEACYLSSSLAVNLAEKFGSRLHILHLSTEKELELFRNDIPLSEKKITAEVCIHHLWFNDIHYEDKASLIKWNPSIKKESDRTALFQALLDNKLDVVATDHAPHTLIEKQNSYFKAPSGGPMVQHSLVSMFEFAHQDLIDPEVIIEKMCHNPAILFNIKNRGFIRKGYYADLVILDPNKKWQVNENNILYKCGWSPMNNQIFSHSVDQTFVNGNLVYDNGSLYKETMGMRLSFNR